MLGFKGSTSEQKVETGLISINTGGVGAFHPPSPLKSLKGIQIGKKLRLDEIPIYNKLLSGNTENQFKVPTNKQVVLLTWNEKKWNDWPGSYDDVVRMVEQGQYYEEEWTIANKSIRKGDEFYLMKTGNKQGIIAKGVIVSDIHYSPHWDVEKAQNGVMTYHIRAKFTEMLDYERADYPTLKKLQLLFPKQHWTPQASGIVIRKEYVQELEKIWDSFRPRVKNQEIDRQMAIELDEGINTLPIEGKEKEAVVRVRVNQGVFRERMLQKYHKCCLCGVSNPDLLIASHIKPWKDSNPEEKLDVNNGLLLCANHDLLFDSGFISFKDNGSIIVSDELDMHNRILMNIRPEMRIRVNEEMKRYLMFHRDNVFKKVDDD